MTSEQRLKKVAELIRSAPIASQGELLASLQEQGISTTQSSISRDLQKLGVVKRKGYYRIPEIVPADGQGVDMLRAESAGPNMIVLKTSPGSASRVGLIIDQACVPEVLGTIAGDDTIFVAVRDEISGRAAVRSIFAIFEI